MPPPILAVVLRGLPRVDPIKLYTIRLIETAKEAERREFDAFEIVFFRALIGIFIVIPLVSKFGVGALKTDR